MYRVELKVLPWCCNNYPFHFVPNVPCGVESMLATHGKNLEELVPNVPCGVESCQKLHRQDFLHLVPNVPCGVERTLL